MVSVQMDVKTRIVIINILMKNSALILNVSCKLDNNLKIFIYFEHISL